MSSRLFAGALAMSLLEGCSYGSLHNSYGMMYNEMFGAQQAERAARDPAPFRGTEAKRIVGAYYDNFGPDDGGGGGNVSQTTSAKSTSTSSNPFSTSKTGH